MPKVQYPHSQRTCRRRQNFLGVHIDISSLNDTHRCAAFVLLVFIFFVLLLCSFYISWMDVLCPSVVLSIFLGLKPLPPMCRPYFFFTPTGSKPHSQLSWFGVLGINTFA